MVATVHQNGADGPAVPQAGSSRTKGAERRDKITDAPGRTRGRQGSQLFQDAGDVETNTDGL